MPTEAFELRVARRHDGPQTMARPTIVRRLTGADEPHLWKALYHALHVPPGAQRFERAITRHPALTRYVEDWMQRPGDLGFLTESNGEVVGAAWLRCWSAEDHGFGFVDERTPELSMAVWPGHRGRGIGTALLTRTLEAAASEHSAVSLSVNLSNPALRLYRRFGFERVGQSADDSATMLKRLYRPRSHR